MISSYLSGGKSSVLYKKLVDEKKMALQVQAVNLGQMDYSVFAFFALPLGETPLDSLLSEIDVEVAKMQNELISERDHQKLINHNKTTVFFKQICQNGGRCDHDMPKSNRVVTCF